MPEHYHSPALRTRRAGVLGRRHEQAAGIVIRILQDIGWLSNLPPLVVLFGHGSSSLNNPHESAYNCGACSGGRGGPNARAFARMANDPRVRKLVLGHGIEIQDEVHFVGAYHNTCNDSVEYFDLDGLPRPHRSLFRRFERSLNEAPARNAHERSRRFESAPLDLTPDAALEHVEQRSEDLSQARPEYNHATNALAVVGRRQWTRGLFMDRRAFVVSYDPQVDDPQATILTRILQAALPVCAGISLEYYFSTVDPEGYGCGSKLPHNVTSMIGVMTGAASDLRPGLSQQMVEIHEPMRILFVVETMEDKMRMILSANPMIARLVDGNWIQLALIDSETSMLQRYNNGNFEPYAPASQALPEVDSSASWYRGQRDHLGFASIRSAWSNPDAGSRPADAASCGRDPGVDASRRSSFRTDRTRRLGEPARGGLSVSLDVRLRPAECSLFDTLLCSLRCGWGFYTALLAPRGRLRAILPLLRSVSSVALFFLRLRERKMLNSISRRPIWSTKV